jgi:multicomponent Na+:H+ antiporter subunit D
MTAPWLPLPVVLSSLLPGIAIFFLAERRVALRSTLNLAGAVVKVALIVAMLAGAARGETYGWRYTLAPGLEFVLIADRLGLLFATLSAALWLVTTVYAIGYLEGSPHRSRFFGFFSLCVSATAGIAMAGNLFTFVLFYEALTWTTYPLVVHRGTDDSLRGGQTYLRYTVAGGTVFLLGAIALMALAGPIDFVDGGTLRGADPALHPQLTAIFAVLVGGLAVKAAIVPLHGWLPVAMVAPAPVSALLHAVAVVKAGAFGIVRVVDSVYGLELVRDLGVGMPLAVAASVTILYGSLRALTQTDLKRRLAFSTVSQVSYITLGLSIFGPAALVGGLVHLVHQGIMKITLFFCAGSIAETLGIHRIADMDGVGRRMPWTMTAFTVAAFGMIGVPPTAGFISKWYLALGGVAAGQTWVLFVLVLSGALNAAYFLPIVRRAWFAEPPAASPAAGARTRPETSWLLLAPLLSTAFLTLAVGLLAGTPFSPLWWVRGIVDADYALIP